VTEQRPTPPAAEPQERAAETQAAAEEPVPAGETASVAAEEPVAPAETATEPAGADAAQEGEAAEASPAEPAPAEPDFHDRYLRAVAELDNVRKRARRDVSAAEGRGVAKLARELLPALDDFERALAAAEAQPENRDHHLTDGIRLVQSQLLAALKRVGIEPEAPKGERFDPHRHEALAAQPVDGAESGTIVEVYSAGYRIGDEILRPAKVVVAA
jgi:molecular chaperone GrpE